MEKRKNIEGVKEHEHDVIRDKGVSKNSIKVTGGVTILPLYKKHFN